MSFKSSFFTLISRSHESTLSHFKQFWIINFVYILMYALVVFAVSVMLSLPGGQLSHTMPYQSSASSLVKTQGIDADMSQMNAVDDPDQSIEMIRQAVAREKQKRRTVPQFESSITMAINIFMNLILLLYLSYLVEERPKSIGECFAVMKGNIFAPVFLMICSTSFILFCPRLFHTESSPILFAIKTFVGSLVYYILMLSFFMATKKRMTLAKALSNAIKSFTGSFMSTYLPLMLCTVLAFSLAAIIIVSAFYASLVLGIIVSLVTIAYFKPFLDFSIVGMFNQAIK